MSNPNLDRFAQGLPDPQDADFDPMAEMVVPCDYCGEPLYIDAEPPQGYQCENGAKVHRDDCFIEYAKEAMGALPI